MYPRGREITLKLFQLKKSTLETDIRAVTDAGEISHFEKKIFLITI